MNRLKQFFTGWDTWLLAAVALLLVYGLVAIWSVEMSRGTHTLITQFAAAGLGVAALITVSCMHPQTIYRLRYIIAGAGLVLLVAVLLFGSVINGTRGWFMIGQVTFQPVEFAKLALLVVLSAILPLHARLRSFRAVTGASIITALYVILILAQPDLGSAMILVAFWAAMLFVSGVPRRYVLLLFVAAVAVGFVAWQFGMHDYQRERILTFLNPSRDPRGRGYNVTQAQIAVGSGGLLGRGFASGSQSQLRFLPESQSDFIFAVISEEFGWWSACTVLAAVSLLLIRLLHLARNATDDFSQFIAVGAATLIFLESFISVGGNIGLIPVTGITLPFVSAGGSSLVAHLSLIGLVQSIHRASLRGMSLRRGMWAQEQ